MVFFNVRPKWYSQCSFRVYVVSAAQPTCRIVIIDLPISNMGFSQSEKPRVVKSAYLQTLQMLLSPCHLKKWWVSAAFFESWTGIRLLICWSTSVTPAPVVASWARLQGWWAGWTGPSVSLPETLRSNNLPSLGALASSGCWVVREHVFDCL